MSEINDVMLSFYNILWQLRYPEITKTEFENIELTILTGENRIRLLSWLLTERSTFIATNLGKLEGTALEDELVKYYSQIGICSDRNVLLGNCTLMEQLPTLKLILEFIKHMHTNAEVKNDSALDTLIEYIIESTNKISMLNSITSKVSYSEATKYFEDINLQNSNNIKGKDSTQSNESLNEDNYTVHDDDEQEYHSQTKKFIEAFESVSSWLEPTTSSFKKNDTNCMDLDIESLYSNVSNLTELLRTVNEVSTTQVPVALDETYAPVNSLVEDIVICTEEALYNL